MFFSNNNINNEMALYALTLGLICEMEGGKELVKKLLMESFSIIDEADVDSSQETLESIEKNRGISQKLGSEEIFEKLSNDLHKKLKLALLHYFDSEKTWAQKMKIEMTSSDK